MTFLALLTKELRLSMRRERTMWIVILYLILLGTLGWFFLSPLIGSTSYSDTNQLNETGLSLYYLLSQLQLFLILFMTPAFTATAINGEKERQTFDLLLCSRISAISLICGKLIAGLANVLLLVAASIPFFSLVFFFGGVSTTQVLRALAIYASTSILTGSLALCCSALFRRPSISSAIAYAFDTLWIALPLLFYFIFSPSSGFYFLLTLSGGMSLSSLYQPPWFFLWSPIMALTSTYPIAAGWAYTFFGYSITPWLAYVVFNLGITLLLFLLSVWIVKPKPLPRLQLEREKVPAPM